MLAAKQDGTAQHAVSQTVCGRVVALIAADVAAWCEHIHRTHYAAGRTTSFTATQSFDFIAAVCAISFLAAPRLA